MSQLSVYSEISPLKKVLLHRPGAELNNLTPQNMHRLLFDDLPDLAGAVEEHDAFAQILESQGAEVLYIEKLLPEVLADDGLRCAFIEDFLSDAGFVLPGHGRDYLVDYLRSLDVETLIETTFAGIRKSDLPNYQPHSLSELLAVSQELLIDPMPNLYFQRDVFTTLGRGVSLNKMRTATRQRESIFPRYLFRHHPELKQTPIYFDPLQDSGFIEGGDILIFNSEVIGIGISERSSSEAIEILAERILRSEDGFKRVLAFKLPVERAFMHLDTVFTMLSHATFAIHQEPQRLFELYELSLNEKGALRTRALVGELSELPLLLFALTGCTSSRTLGHVDFAGSGFYYNGSFIGRFNSEDMQKIQEIRVDQHGDLKITELNLDPQVYTPFTRVSGFISHQGNHFYYQLEHLRYEYTGVSHVRQLSVYAYEIRSYDLDTGEDRRIIYRNNADFDIITKPFYVDGDRVFRVQWNSIYEEGIAGSRLFLNLEEFKQILTIYDGKIWGVDHGDTLRSYDLTQGEERTYPSCIPGSNFSVSDDGKMYFVNSWKSALCEYDLKQDQLRYIYEIPEAHCYLIGQFASHIYYAYMDPTILRDRVAQVDVSGKRLADLEVELVPTDQTIPIEGGVLVASASGDLKYIPNS